MQSVCVVAVYTVCGGCIYSLCGGCIYSLWWLYIQSVVAVYTVCVLAVYTVCVLMLLSRWSGWSQYKIKKNTHSEYLIPIAFRRQKLSRERPSIWRLHVRCPLPVLVANYVKTVVLISQKTHTHISFTAIHTSLLFRKMTVVYLLNIMKYTNKHCGQNAEFICKFGDIYIYIYLFNTPY
jgi:hypothetical protein